MKEAMEQKVLHTETAAAEHDWSQQALGELITHIEQTHHVFVRREVPHLARLIDKIVKAHGAARPQWLEVQRVFLALGEELMQHLLKEEQILFPYVRQFEQWKSGAGAAPQEACFGTVQNPIRMMMHEHMDAKEALQQLRTLTQDYAIRPEDCSTLETALKALPAFEADLYQHIHLEDDVLFPRAVELEQQR